MYTRGKHLLSQTEVILKKYALPTELKMLLTLESAYNGNAVSKAGAVGYWQIMDQVAGEYGMKYISRQKKSAPYKPSAVASAGSKTKQRETKRLRDDRRDFLLSTHAAAKYLRDRSRDLGNNLLLVVASYNCGVGNVWKAMKRSGKANPGFWDIKKYLPAETRAYVMNFITLNVIYNNYDLFSRNELSFVPEMVILPGDAEKVIARVRDQN